MIDLQEEYGLAYLFISHDLAVMRHISHRIAVMYLGRIVELTDKRTLFARPLHPYTEALLSSATAPDPKRRRLRKTIVQGDVPSPANPPPGCHFHTRCPYAIAECRVTSPPLIEVAPGHHVACLRSRSRRSRPLRGRSRRPVRPCLPAVQASGRRRAAPGRSAIVVAAGDSAVVDLRDDAKARRRSPRSRPSRFAAWQRV